MMNENKACVNKREYLATSPGFDRTNSIDKKIITKMGHGGRYCSGRLFSGYWDDKKFG
jgi:hypothetical protein